MNKRLETYVDRLIRKIEVEQETPLSVFAVQDIEDVMRSLLAGVRERLREDEDGCGPNAAHAIDQEWIQAEVEDG